VIIRLVIALVAVLAAAGCGSPKNSVVRGMSTPVRAQEIDRDALAARAKRL
jgi:hypothetical protein